MWCRECQREVPFIPVGDENEPVCGYCGLVLDDNHRAGPVEHGGEGWIGPLAEIHAMSEAAHRVEHPEQASQDDRTSDSDSVEPIIAWNSTASGTDPHGDKREDDPLADLPPLEDEQWIDRDWELSDELHNVQWLLRSGQVVTQSGQMSPHAQPSPHGERSPSHASPTHPRIDRLAAHAATPTRSGSANSGGNRTRGKTSLPGWAALLSGLTALACGVVLLGWSYVDARPELWDVGLPIALSGQAVLLVGLVLHLQSIWIRHQETSGQLEMLDGEIQQLHVLRRTAQEREHSESFYSHLADGAAPQVLLADLKGQLDRIVARLDPPQR